jgi:hypothetical protein
MCALESQHCTNDCSGHGECRYLSTFNANISLPTCAITDYDCTAVCACEDGFRGRDCSVPTHDFTAMLNLRHDIVMAVKNISMIQERSRENIVSWLDSLSVVAVDADSILSKTKILIATLVIEFLDVATTLGASHEELASVGPILDLVLPGPFTDGADDSVARTLMQRYGEYISTDMPVGQNPVVLVNDAFRITSMSLGVADNATAYAPVSAMESLVNRHVNSVTIQPCGATDAYKLVVSESGPAHNGNASVLSKSFGLSIDSSVIGSCPFIVTMQYAFPIPHDGFNKSIAETAEFECKSGLVEEYEHTCSNGLILNRSCNGTIAGVVRQMCPAYQPSAACASIGDAATICNVIDATPYNVSCACVLPSGEESAGRRLQDTDDHTGGSEDIADVEFIAIGENVVVEFAETWASADDLSARDVQGSWQVLVTVASIGVVSAVLMVAGWYADNRMLVKVASTSAGKEEPESSRKNRFSKRLSSLSAMLTGRKGSHLPLVRTSRSKSFHRTAEETSVDAALPMVLKPLPIWKKFKIEAQIYHRYIWTLLSSSCVCFDA